MCCEVVCIHGIFFIQNFVKDEKRKLKKPWTHQSGVNGFAVASAGGIVGLKEEQKIQA